MKQQTLGTMIASKRKELGMTQLELATKMNVTDKAVSKWERDISCPDINSLPRLAEELGVTADELLQCKGSAQKQEESKAGAILSLVLKVIPMAMGVSVTVLAILGKADMNDSLVLIGIGLASAGVSMLNEYKDTDK